MRLIFMYSDEDPARGAGTPSSLPNLDEAWRPHKSLLLLQMPPLVLPQSEISTRALELRNHEVELPYGDDSQFWCTVFKLDKLAKKHHIIKVILNSEKTFLFNAIKILYQFDSFFNQ